MDSRWAAGTYDGLPLLAWETENRLWLLPSDRTAVIAPADMGEPVSPDRVDGIVSHLLTLGMSLLGDPLDLADRAASGWKLVVEYPDLLELTDPAGQSALLAEGLRSEIKPWLAAVRSYRGALLYSGSGLLDPSGEWTIDAARNAGTLVQGWANLGTRRTVIT